MDIRRLTPDDLPRLRRLWRERWGDEFVVAHGRVYRPDELDGFAAVEGEGWLGCVTFSIRDGECEIVTLDSLRERSGIGTDLLRQAVEVAGRRGCRRVFLITTNDNLAALAFYQKRGFELAALHRGAINAARRLKPAIPAVGAHGIPLRDELELEISLRAGR
jgi:ribosomal protein S18 acetylase RimI-like enzyme